MFYELKLLCPQKEGIFANVWIAATLGVKRLTKEEISSTNIAKISAEIEEMVVTQSQRPKKRLSLRLAAILVNGTTKIYMEQVITLQEDIVSFFCYVKKPSQALDTSFKRPRSVTTKKKHPRRIQPAEAPVEQEDQIEIPPGSFIRKVTDILPTTSTAVEEAERLKSFGPEGGEDLIREIEKLIEDERIEREARETSARAQEEGREIVEVPERTGAEITELSELQTIAKEGAITETPKKKKTREDDQIEAIETPKKRRKLLQDQTTEAEAAQTKQDEVPGAETIRKRKRLNYDTDETNTTTGDLTIKNINNKLVKFKKPPQRKLINRIEAHGNELFDKWSYDNIVPDLVRTERENPEKVNFNYLISEFFKIESQFPPQMAGVHPSASTKDKGSSSKISAPKKVTTVTPNLEIQGEQPAVPPKQFPTPLEHQIPAIVVTSPQSGEIVSEIVPHSQDIEPIERTDGQPNLETVTEDVALQPLVVEQASVRPVQGADISPVQSVSSTGERRRTVEERQKRLAKVLFKWNKKEMGEITIEKLCPEPINRLNFTRTFSDLLHLSNMGYVKLHSKPNSIELGEIEIGEKLLRKYKQ